MTVLAALNGDNRNSQTLSDFSLHLHAPFSVQLHVLDQLQGAYSALMELLSARSRCNVAGQLERRRELGWRYLVSAPRRRIGVPALAIQCASSIGTEELAHLFQNSRRTTIIRPTLSLPGEKKE